MVALVVALVTLIGFEVAALRWGADSRETSEDPEWERRRAWRGFH